MARYLKIKKDNRSSSAFWARIGPKHFSKFSPNPVRKARLTYNSVTFVISGIRWSTGPDLQGAIYKQLNKIGHFSPILTKIFFSS